MTTKLHTVGQIETATGLKVNPLNMRANDLCITDIAHALARICRFGGHTSGFISVARHSLEVLEWAKKSIGLDKAPQLARTLLLHDASEAYLGDVPRPLKQHPAFAFYREAEARLEGLIAKKFDLIYPFPPLVKVMDEAVLKWEMEKDRHNDLRIDGFDEAKANFLKAYYDLTD